MYEKLFQDQEEIFKVLANQKRLEIIQLLTHGELAVNEMASMLGIPQSNVSQHLSLMRQTGILSTRKDGTTVYYRLSDIRIAEACSFIRQFLISSNKLPDTSVLEESPKSTYPLVHDPVCGMRMSISEVSKQVKQNGRTYFFCASGCKDKFIKQPSRYTLKDI